MAKTTAAKKEKLDRALMVRMPASELKRLRVVALAEGRSASYVGRRAILAEIEKREARDGK